MLILLIRNSTQANDEPVRDTYRHDGAILDWSIEDDRFEIMASILPSRTAPLGHKNVCDESYGVGEVKDGCVDLEEEFNYSESNYDHSAQWLAAYHMRFGYWDRVCIAFFGENLESSCLRK